MLLPHICLYRYSYVKLLSEQKMPEGSWKCEQCGNINYPFRTKCNKQNCGADKPSEAEKSPPPAEDENDQVCCVMCSLYSRYLNLLLLLSTICTIINKLSGKIINSHVKSLNVHEVFIFDMFYSMTSFVHSLISNCLLFQWVLGHIWGLRRSRVVVQLCYNVGVWKSVLSSSCCSGCQVLYPLIIRVKVVVSNDGLYGLCGSSKCIICQPAGVARIIQFGFCLIF